MYVVSESIYAFRGVYCYMKIKSLKYILSWKYENEWKTLWVSSIHFLSKTFFMINKIKPFFFDNLGPYQACIMKLFLHRNSAIIGWQGPKCTSDVSAKSFVDKGMSARVTRLSMWFRGNDSQAQFNIFDFCWQLLRRI